MVRAKARRWSDTALVALDARTFSSLRPLPGVTDTGGPYLMGLIRSWAFHHPLLSFFLKIRFAVWAGGYKAIGVCCKILETPENYKGENKNHLYSQHEKITASDF